MSKLPDKCTSNFQTHNSELPEIKKAYKSPTWILSTRLLRLALPPELLGSKFRPSSASNSFMYCSMEWAILFRLFCNAGLFKESSKNPCISEIWTWWSGEIVWIRTNWIFFLSLSQINLMLCSIFLAYKKCILLFENFWLYKYLHIIASNMLCIENSLSEHKLTGFFFIFLTNKSLHCLIKFSNIYQMYITVFQLHQW